MKIKKDDLGLFVFTNGTKFRPGNAPGYDHAMDTGDGGYKEGDVVKARHVSQTQYVKVCSDGHKPVYWMTDYFHESHRSGPYDNPKLRARDEAEGKLCADLWEKHAHADRHGYKDDMHENGFSSAITELLEMVRSGTLPEALK